VRRRRWHGPCPRGKKHTHTAHARTDKRARANVAGRLAAAVIGLKINARAATIPLHAPPTRPTRPRATAANTVASVVRPYNYFRFISPSHAHTRTASASAAPHRAAPHCTARCTGVRRRCTRLQTKLPRHRVAETAFHRPSRRVRPTLCNNNNNNNNYIVILQ